MKPATEAWVRLAEVDFETAEWVAERGAPLPEPLGFHAHQCVEKYLKAVAEEAGRPVPRVHDLGIVLDGIADLVPLLAARRDAIEAMVPFAAVLRYPYEESLFPDIDEDAEQAATTMRTVRSNVRAALGMPLEASPGAGSG